MSRLIEIFDINEFSDIRKIPDVVINEKILSKISALHEVNELEKSLREIIYDPTETPHGPTEIADILTSDIHVLGVKRLAGFVLKGKSFEKVTSRDVTHQFAKLRTIPGLGVMIFAAVGHIQDDAQRDFVQTALDAKCDYLIINAHQCAKLLLAYEKICPKDGTLFNDKGLCLSGHRLDEGISLEMTVREKVRATVASLKDISHGGAKRYSANILLDKHYPKDLVRDIIFRITEQLKDSRYYRNNRTKTYWGDTPAHVVWLFVGCEIDDLQNNNWVCRSCWIDPSLPKEMQPFDLKGNDYIYDIQIDWNYHYEGLKEQTEQNQSEKGKFLEHLSLFKNKMIILGDKATQCFSEYKLGLIGEDALIYHFQSMEKTAKALYTGSSKLSLPPPDCKDYDQECQNLFLIVHNMFQFYSPHGLETWEKPNRELLFQSTVKRYFEIKQLLTFEERKIH